MRKTFLVISLAVGFSVLAGAQDDAQYKAWMKTLGPEVGAIKNAADNAAAAPDATKLAETMDKVAEYWKAKNAPDAVTFSETARDAAKMIAAGTGDKAENLMKIQSTCGGCHHAHRDGKAPDFTIK